MDRASDYGSEGYGFDSCRARHIYFLRNVAQLGRALGLGPRGRRFESCLPDHATTKLEETWGLSSAGRAPALHAGGQRFDPARLHHIILEVYPSSAEGIGLDNRQAGHTARGFESLFLLVFKKYIMVR